MNAASSNKPDKPDEKVFFVEGKGWYARSAQGEPIGPFETKSEAEDVIALQDAYRDFNQNPPEQ